MFADPQQVIERLGITPGLKVADFGAGSGAYTLALAARVGESGRVYAVDVQQNLLERLAAVAKERKLRNIEVIWGDIEKRGGAKLGDNAVDRVLLSNVLFQSAARYSLALEAKRVLRPGGEAIVVEWSGSFGGLGPTPTQVVTPASAKEVFAQAGFEAAGEFSAGAHHYALVFKKP